LKKIVLLFFILANLGSWSQKSNAFIDHRITYTSSEGYNIIDPTTAVYDELGWLWIAGNKAAQDEYLFEGKDIIIQRFDGVSFYSVSLPPSNRKIRNVFLFKNGSEGLFARFDYEKGSSNLYHINAETLVFSKIEDYPTFEKKYHYITGFILGNKLTFVHASKDEVVLVQISDKEAKIIDRVPFTFKLKFYPPRTLSHKGIYTVLSITNGVHYLINNKGEFVRKISPSDFKGLSTTQFEKIDHIRYIFDYQGQPVFEFETPDYQFFTLDEKTLKFTELTSFDFIKDKNKHWSGSNDDYFFTFEKKEEISVFGMHDIQKNFTLVETLNTDDFHTFAYRDLNKELLLLYGNTLDRIVFNQNKIKTYLKGESIRTVKEISNDKYIVATDNKGLYELNTITGETEKIQFTYQGGEFFITEPREIINTKEGYIFNDKTNLYEVNRNYEIQQKYEHPNWLEVTFQLGDTIFKGGVHNSGIQRFSLKDKTYHLVKEDIQIREFATDGSSLFGISVRKGPFEYKNGKITFYAPEEETPNNFLSIFYDKNDGLLVSTKQGKIYSFNPETKTFKLFYQDKLKASIVGMITDDARRVWLNTYAGIVSYDPVTQEEKRYTKKDGVFELEGNRYSTYKDSKGNIFIGSFKGLSFFDPKELDSEEKELKLMFTELSFFDTEEALWKVHNKPGFLNSVEQISLPSYNQRFSARVAFLDIVNSENYNYRYRLVNASEDNVTEWNKLYLENEIVFSNLSAGAYTLQIEVLSSVNKKVGKTLELQIVSHQIFYKTGWFAFIILLVVIGVFSYLFYQFKSKQQLYAANQIAINEAKVKEVMMLEIHHRIKNNLQVVSGLLSLQAFSSKDKELKTKLQDSQGRIESIAGIHNILYKGNSQEEIVVAEYFNDIISYNKTLFSQSVSYNLNISSVKLPMDKAIPLALILNELINNSHKHAFSATENPSIHVEFKEGKSNYTFLYTDNGTFKEKVEERISMGMKIISMMILQLKGKDTIREDGSFQLELVFPKSE
jgi:two-component sensor histidine kinase